MKFYNGFVGEDTTNITLKYLGSDDEETLQKNLTIQTEDWYYRDKEITYVMNEYGHRCKSLKNIDLDNYILFLGCSITLGMGVELEKSFTYLIAQEKKCDYYNLSLGGTGIDVVEHNLINWFFTVEKKPKYVVLQYPAHVRFVSMHPGYTSLIKNGPWFQAEESKKFIASSDESGYFLARGRIVSSLINNVVDAPAIRLNLAGFPRYDSHPIIKNLDFARDLVHGGNKTNEKIAESVLDQMK